MTRFTSLEHCITNVVKDTVKMWKWLFVNLKMFNCRVVKRNSGPQLLISEIERAERQNGNIVPASIERLAVAFPFTNFGRLRFEFSYRTGITVFHFIIFTFYFSNCVHLIRHAVLYYFPCSKSTYWTIMAYQKNLPVTVPTLKLLNFALKSDSVKFTAFILGKRKSTPVKD